MKNLNVKKILLIFIMVFISLLVIGAASAADSDDSANLEILEMSNVDEVETIGSDVDSVSENVLADGESGDGDDVDDGEITNENPISINAQDTPYGEDANIEISVSDKEQFPEGSLVNIYMDGLNVENKTLDSEGKATYTVPGKSLDVGNYNIGTVINNVFSEITVLKITKVTPVVSVDDVTVKSGKS